MAKKRKGKCPSALRGELCVRMEGHKVGFDVFRDRENVHWGQGGMTRWIDAAADPTPTDSETESETT